MSFATAFVLLLACKAAALYWMSLRQVRAAKASVATEIGELSEAIGQEGIDKAAAYAAARQGSARMALAVSTTMALLWTIGGGLAWLDGLVLGLGGVEPNGIVHGLLSIGSFSLIGAAVHLPLSIHSTFYVEESFGFNRTSPGLFLADMAKSLVLSLLLGCVLLGAILWLMDRLSGTLWWLWAWAFLVVWNLALILIYPRWLAPLFNRFTPLPEGELRERIGSLLERCGFNADAVFVMDGSRRSSHGNAYFTGLGRNKRVVFFDSLIETLDVGQTEAVLAHELGHSALGHIPKTLAITIALWLPALWLLDYLLGAEWFFAAFGLGAANHLALLLFALVLPPFIFPLQPLMNGLSRKHEFEADAYAAKHSDRQSLITALVRMYKDNAVTLGSDPLYSLWHETHPPPIQRIARLKSLPAQ